MSDLTDNVTTVLYTDDYLDKKSYLLRGFEMIEPVNNYTVDELWRNLTKLNDTGLVEIYRYVLFCLFSLYAVSLKQLLTADFHSSV